MLLKKAFAKSTNSVAVRLGIEMGLKNIIKTAHDMGIKSELDTHPSTILGASDVNLLEMVNAYCTIANDGLHHEPVLVSKILDNEGNVIYEGPSDCPRVLPYKSAFFMQQMLMNGVREGTSRSLASYVGYWAKTDIGGKTGTSNNASDGWFVGVTPHLVCGAWVGGEYRQIRFRSARLGQGAYTALPICGRFLSSVLMDGDFTHYRQRFVIPAGEDISLDLFDCAAKPSVSISTIQTDTSEYVSTVEMLDEEGNPISTPPMSPSGEEGDAYPPENETEIIIDE